MKRQLQWLIILAAFPFSDVCGQNTPGGLGLSGNMSGRIARPFNFNEGGNSTPTHFNFSRTFIPLGPVTSLPSYENSGGLPVLVNTRYTNGFGSPIMDVIRNNSSKNIIIPYYNIPSRTNVSFLPFNPSVSTQTSKFLTTVFTEDSLDYRSKYYMEEYSGYSKSLSYSNGGIPTTKTFAPGRSFVGDKCGTITSANINGAGEVYKIEYNSGLVKTGTYAAGALSVVKTTDTHRQVTVTYTDKNGKLICKKQYAGAGQGNNGWLETYYVYNDLKELIYIIPPKASLQLAGNTTISNVNQLCFSYKYDKYGSVIEKRTPGQSHAESIVYDRKRRPVLTQNAALRNEGKWTFNIYDSRNRVVVTGIYSSNSSRAALQGKVDSLLTSPAIVGHITTGFTGTYPTSIASCEIQGLNYYDDYANVPSQASGVTFDAATWGNDYLTGTQMIVPTPHYFMNGKLVASAVRILDNGIGHNFLNGWITTVYYYDDKGRVIQTHTQNPWNTSLWDVSAVQYNFTGNVVLSISNHHSWGSTDKASTKVQTWNVYDSLTGRLNEVRQKMDDEPWLSLAAYHYGDLGELKRKVLGNVEEQIYDYNIRGQLAGINNGFINYSGSLPMMSFFEELYYDVGYTQPRFDGKIAGYQWRTPSIPKSSYGYSYDTAGRMTAAAYRDWNTSSWNTNLHDYSVSNISFDANSNMLTMSQRGPDSAGAPALIDSLIYSYDGNLLETVTDHGVDAPNTDDFISGITANYVYDAAGNLESDDGKGIEMTYNYMGLPEHIDNQALAGTIDNIYTAGGTLLQKIVVNGSTSTVDTLVYWGPFVYKNSALQYMLHEEGRSRWISDSSFFKNDFFVKDHLGNVRTVVACDLEPVSQEYLATHEIASANIEEAIFSNISEVRTNKPLGTPADGDCALLNATSDESRIGTALLLQVMAGDKISLGAYSYHAGKDPENDNYTGMEEMLTTVLGVFSNGVGGEDDEGGNMQVVNGLFNSTNYAQFETLKNSATNANSPRAFLNYVFFDEEFNFNPDGSGAIQVSGSSNSWEHLSLPNDLHIPQNGYIAIYISNEEAMDVFFDEVSIFLTHGRLLEEQHYYPHGLLTKKTVALSVANPENKYQFQGNEWQDQIDMKLYDFNARQYDAQIGRFTAIDPLADYMQESFSPYHFCFNDPANYTDPSGLIGDETGCPKNKKEKNSSTFWSEVESAIRDFFSPEPGSGSGGGAGGTGSGQGYGDSSGGSGDGGTAGSASGGSDGSAVRTGHGTPAVCFTGGTPEVRKLKTLTEADMKALRQTSHLQLQVTNKWDVDPDYRTDNEGYITSPSANDFKENWLVASAWEVSFLFNSIAGFNYLDNFVSGFQNRNAIDNAVQFMELGVSSTARGRLRTSTGIEITGFTDHALNRVIERGVKPDAILDAIKIPLKVGKIIHDNLGRPSIRFVGTKGEVVLNPYTGTVISVNPTSSKKAIRLIKQQGR